jgi:hypothetical protein
MAMTVPMECCQARRDFGIRLRDVRDAGMLQCLAGP